MITSTLQNGIAQELILVESASLASDYTSVTQDIRFFQLGSMQITWTNTDSSTGSFRPQVSLDQVYWCDLIDSSDYAGPSTTETCAFYAFDIAPFPYLRLFYKRGSATQGNFTVRTFFKKMNTAGG